MHTLHYKTSSKDILQGAELMGRGLSFIRTNGIAVTKTEYSPTEVKPRMGTFIL